MRFLLTIVFAVRAWAAVDPQLLALMPPNADMVVGMNMDQSRGTPFGEHMLRTMAGTGLPSLFQKIDIGKDIAEFVLTASGNSMLIAARLGSTARPIDPGTETSETYRGVRLMIEKIQKEEAAAAIVNGTFFVVGNKGFVKGAIDRALDKPKASTAILIEATRVSTAGQLWAVGSPKIAAGVFPGAQSYSVSLGAPRDGGVDVLMDVGFGSPKAARDLASQLKMPSAHANVAGSKVTITVTLPQQQAEAMFVPR